MPFPDKVKRDTVIDEVIIDRMVAAFHKSNVFHNSGNTTGQDEAFARETVESFIGAVRAFVADDEPLTLERLAQLFGTYPDQTAFDRLMIDAGNMTPLYICYGYFANELKVFRHDAKPSVSFNTLDCA